MIQTSRKHDKRGATLIVVLGVLVLLSLIGTSFAVVMRVERSISRNYLDGVRAKLLAKSGVHDAISRLSSGVESGKFMFPENPGSLAWVYYGDDTREISGIMGKYTVDIQEAKNPSFAWEDEAAQNPFDFAVQPKLIKVEGKEVGFSGSHDSNTYTPYGDQYVLKISDAQSRLYVNEGVGENQLFGVRTRQMERLLNNLGELLRIRDLGTILMGNRPIDGYRNKRQLLTAIGGNEEVFNRFKDFVTCYAWVDTGVINPVPLSQDVLHEYPIPFYRGAGQPIYRRGRGKDYRGRKIDHPLMFSPPAPADDPRTFIWGVDELAPQWIESTSRAPINVNTAPREILIALLADLKGFFTLGRRRNNPKTNGRMYDTMQSGNTYSDEMRAPSGGGVFALGGLDRGEIARLFVTVPIVMGTQTTTNAISAQTIAEEIISCRTRTVSRNKGAFDYGQAAFGGPFKTWRQFEAFCDNLVETGILVDEREQYKDYSPTNVNNLGYGPLVRSKLQEKYAAQAIADVLKANFNPNVHLNEYNPDANLYKRVDKTDLIVNSTEFCFTPMGFYEIESLGRILRPTDDAKSALDAEDNEIVATRKIESVVQIFRVHRDTTQQDFWRGTVAPITNNRIRTGYGRSLEIGPEPDNGKNPEENTVTGYVALPLHGGEILGRGELRGQGTLRGTPTGGSEYGEVLHAHFTLDHNAHYHVAGKNQELGSHSLPGEGCENYPDPGATKPGPYGPVSDHRLSKSFRLPGNGNPPPLEPYATSDLRIDGAYIERHSGVSYMNGPALMHPELMAGSRNTAGRDPLAGAKGAASYWVKPWFEPELAGKIRLYLDISRFRARAGMTFGSLFQGFDPLPFFHIWLPSHDTLPYTRPNEFQPVRYQAVCKPSSMIFGYDWGGCLTSTLNHVTHDHGTPGYQNRFAAHKWTHIAIEWSGTRRRMYINGELLAEGIDQGTYGSGSIGFIAGHLWPASSPGNSPWYKSPHGNYTTPIRIGSPSKIGGEPSNWLTKRNWSSDSTVDEFYFWKGIPGNRHLQFWNRGRYVIPQEHYEGAFTSGPIVPGIERRQMAPPAPIKTPNQPGSTMVATSGGVGRTTIENKVRAFRVIGMSWTWLAEEVENKDNVLTPYLVDYADSFPRRTKLYPRISASILIPSTRSQIGPFFNDAYSPMIGDTRFSWDDTVQYQMKFQLPDAGRDTILLASPVLDDVTVYYLAPEVKTHMFYVE